MRRASRRVGGLHGGTTESYSLTATSPALDAGACTDSFGNPVTVDQRGMARPFGPECDAGSFESCCPGPVGNAVRTVRQGDDILVDWPTAVASGQYNVYGTTSAATLPASQLLTMAPLATTSQRSWLDVGGVSGRPSPFYYRVFVLDCIGESTPE